MPDRSRSRYRPDSLRNRLRYRFDLVLARGAWAPLLWLAVVTLLAVLLAAILLAAFGATFAGSEGTSWIEDLWQTLLRVVDPGTMAADVGWPERLLALLVTVFGILVAGTLIGLIASAVEQRVEAMRRGRSTVVESGHIVILGASARLPVVIEQLAIAHRKRRSNTIVVMADAEPADLSDKVRAIAGDLHGSRLVVRRGDPTRISDLAIVAVEDARSVIVLADEDARGDAGVVNAVLAVGTQLGGFDRVPIVAELSDPETAEILIRACGGAVDAVVASRAVARITAFALREPGLSEVVQELVDFRGADIYIRSVGALAGETFGDCVFRFTKARPIGRVRSDGEVDLNPSPDSRFDKDDRLVVLADDEQSGRLASEAFHAEVTGPSHLEPRAEPGRWSVHLLIIGWNSLGAQLISQLDPIATPGSSVEIIYDPGLFDVDELGIPETERIGVTLTPSRRSVWQIGDRTLDGALTSIVLLGYRHGTSVEEADSRTLVNLMVLRRDLERRDAGATWLIVELLDAHNVQLARSMGAHDYVVSDAIASRLIAQVAEQPERRTVLGSLYATEGASVNLVRAADLGVSGETAFGDIVAAAYASGLLAIGWRSSQEREVILNPDISERAHLAEGDQIVVIG